MPLRNRGLGEGEIAVTKHGYFQYLPLTTPGEGCYAGANTPPLRETSLPLRRQGLEPVRLCPEPAEGMKVK